MCYSRYFVWGKPPVCAPRLRQRPSAEIGIGEIHSVYGNAACKRRRAVQCKRFVLYVANTAFEAALTINPDDVGVRMNYGYFLGEIAQDKAGAVQQWQIALATNPDEATAKRLQELIDNYRQP